MNKNKRNIQNPEKWIGKYVRHMANWWDFAWANNGYIVCEWTGKLLTVESEAHWSEFFGTMEEAEEAGYDQCYYYSHEGLMDMYRKAALKAA